MNRTSRRPWAAGLACAIALIAAACSTADDDAGVSTSTSTSTVPASTTSIAASSLHALGSGRPLDVARLPALLNERPE